MIKADGFDAAILGIGVRCGSEDILVYSVEKAIEVLMERDGMDEEEAQEFLDFNVIGSWVGPETPMWMTSLDTIGGLEALDEWDYEDDMKEDEEAAAVYRIVKMQDGTEEFANLPLLPRSLAAEVSTLLNAQGGGKAWKVEKKGYELAVKA